jgi:tRNA modification GTPase
MSSVLRSSGLSFGRQNVQTPQKPETLDDDTIVAVATAAGQAGVGIVRVSGPLAETIAEAISGEAPVPRRVRVREFRGADGVAIDRGIVLYFAKPKSFTGECVVEFQGHGGPVVLQLLLDEIIAQGARLARPGEFTERAFINGKLDLAQAEAVADLIASASVAAARGANRSLSGEFSASVRAIDAKVVDLRMFVEAAIDFPEEDIDLLADGEVAGRLDAVHTALENLQAESAQGLLLRDGITLALIGAPNVGKSSLLNALAGEAHAIVTDIPGTTRDLVRADLVLDGLPVQLVDTAGLRDSIDPIEREGVRRARAEAAAADIVLCIVSSQTEWSFEEAWLDSRRLLKVVNKIDLGLLPGVELSADMVGISALTGTGLATLVDSIKSKVGYLGEGARFTARKRHLLALERALAATVECSKMAAGVVSVELIAEELRCVHRALGDIVGEMTPDELLGEIFSQFCVGK